MRRKYLHKSEVVGTRHPAAKLINDDVLEPFVQWILEEQVPNGRTSRYLLLSAKEYMRACRKFEAGSDTFKANLVESLRDELRREQQHFNALDEELRSTRDELAELKANAAETERAMARAESELNAYREAKVRLLRVLETAQASPELRGTCRNMFDIIEKMSPPRLSPPARRYNSSGR